jgi:hypothetical protein
MSSLLSVSGYWFIGLFDFFHISILPALPLYPSVVLISPSPPEHDEGVGGHGRTQQKYGIFDKLVCF